MQAKDMNIIIETAREHGIPLPSAAIDAQLYNSMVDLNLGNQDNSAVLAILELLANVKLIGEDN
jgi:2-hydroxy-3-oxopropionate reductase